MKVKELMEKLKEYNPEAEVTIGSQSCFEEENFSRAPIKLIYGPNNAEEITLLVD